MLNLSSTIIDIINETIGIDRKNLLSNASSLIDKFKIERDKLRNNFITNLPINYNDETKFNNLSSDINKLHEKILNLKLQNTQLNQTIDNYKSEKKSEKQLQLENELKPLIKKSIEIERYLLYIRCLIDVSDLNSDIEAKLGKLVLLQAKLKSMSDSNNNKNTSENEKTLSLSINKLNNDYNKHLNEIIELYLSLISKYKQIKNAECFNLNSYLTESIDYFNEQINSILTNEFEDILKCLSYPFINRESEKYLEKSSAGGSNSKSSTNALLLLEQQNELNEKKLDLCCKRIIQIELSRLRNENQSQMEASKNSYSTPLVIILLTKPFNKRFKYHFYGNKKTNNINKPEWYLSQIIQWIKDHQQFLFDKIQPIFDKYYKDFEKIDSIGEFIKSLIHLAKEKFEDDFNKYLKSDETQYSHTIDELILFNQQLIQYFKYSFESYNCFNILCDNETIFSNWLQLEYKICTKKVDLMFSNRLSNEIWSCNFADIDDKKPPHCTESFMLLIKTISDRYENLPYASKKLRFLKMQITLMDDYRLRLCQINRDELKDPLSKTNFGVLNAINYILFILDEWKNSKFFIEMQFLKSRYKQFEEKFQIQRKLSEHYDHQRQLSNNEASVDVENELFVDGENDASTLCEYQFELGLHKDLCKVYDLQIKNLSIVSNELSEFIDIKSTVFDDLLQSYQKICDDMVDSIVSNCMWEIKTRGKQYRKEKWMLMPQVKEFYKANLTQSAADMLISIKNLIHLLHDSLALKLFLIILKRLANEIDRYFYEDIIKDTQFNDGGSSQMAYDINKYLLPILSEYARDIKIDTYFRRTKEALILLQVNQGSALLLKEILAKSLHPDLNQAAQEKPVNSNLLAYNARNALKEFGILQLSSDEAELILSLRVDL